MYNKCSNMEIVKKHCVYILIYVTIYSGMTNNVVIILYVALIIVASCIIGSALVTLYDILFNVQCCVKTAKVIPIEDALEVSYDSERSLASAYGT